jgi:dynein heavy chain
VDQKEDIELRDFLEEMFDKWIPPILKTKRMCKELIPCIDTTLVMSLCKFLDSLDKQDSTKLSFKNPPKTDEYWQLLDRYFAFAVLWTLGGTVNEDGRKIIDYKFRDIESFFPVNSIYDYYINIEKGEFSPWEEKISQSWKPNANEPFHRMLVPTVDTIRNRYILQSLVQAGKQILVVGSTGTGKTAIIDSMLQRSLDDSYAAFYINFSAQTTSRKTQEIIESKLKYRSKVKMVPEGNKQGVIFIDDLNMPKKEKFGAQPPLELLRQYIDYGGWYDRTNLDTFKWIIDIQMIAAMGPPGGGRAEISQRTQSKFNVINFTFPSDSQVRRIFQQIMGHHFLSQDFEEDIRPLAEPLAMATIHLYHKINEFFKATPAKAHYVFNLRDISKVIQGIR